MSWNRYLYLGKGDESLSMQFKKGDIVSVKMSEVMKDISEEDLKIVEEFIRGTGNICRVKDIAPEARYSILLSDSPTQIRFKYNELEPLFIVENMREGWYV